MTDPVAGGVRRGSDEPTWLNSAGCVDVTNWRDWHDLYSRPGSGLADRLAAVQAHIRRRLDDTAPRSVQVISLCAGDGRDLLSVLREREDADNITTGLR